MKHLYILMTLITSCGTDVASEVPSAEKLTQTETKTENTRTKDEEKKEEAKKDNSTKSPDISGLGSNTVVVEKETKGSCTTARDEKKKAATIKCVDGTESIVYDGKDGTAGTNGIDGAKGDSAKKGYVYDNAGRSIGEFVSSTETNVYVRVPNTDLVLAFNIDSPYNVPVTGHSYFTAANCTGTIYRGRTVHNLANTHYRYSNSTWYTVTGAIVGNITYASYEAPNGTCYNTAGSTTGVKQIVATNLSAYSDRITYTSNTVRATSGPFFYDE